MRIGKVASSFDEFNEIHAGIEELNEYYDELERIKEEEEIRNSFLKFAFNKNSQD